MHMDYRGRIWGERVVRMEWSGGGKWDNCNSIINKYIKKKKERKTRQYPHGHT